MIQITNKTHQNLLLANLLANVPDAVRLATGHGEVRLHVADIHAKVGQHMLAVGGQINFGVELDTVYPQRLVEDSRHDGVVRYGGDLQATADHVDAVAVRQQHVLPVVQVSVRV